MKLFALLLLVGVAQAQGLSKYAPGQKQGQTRTNYALNSNGLSVGTSAATGWALSTATVTTQASPAPVGGGTWAAVTSTANTGYMSAAPAITVPSSTKHVGSVYMVKASGTGYASIEIGAAGYAYSACTCTRSDAGTCTVAADTANYCRATVADLTTTPIRVTISTTGSAVTGVSMFLFPQRYGVANDTTWFSGVQLEAGVTKASKLCVTTTAAKLCKD